MNPFSSKGIPPFIEKELEKMDELVKPKLKKSSKYMFIGIPLLLLSIINLFYMLIITGFNSDRLLSLGIYALIGAIGTALFREARHLNKEIRQIGINHIIKRINAGEYVNDYMKNQYLDQIHSKPKLSLQTFFNFLSEENQRSNL